MLIPSMPWEESCCWVWCLVDGESQWLMVFRDYQVRQITSCAFEIRVLSTPTLMTGVVVLGEPEEGTA
jgi:hypothetical protein